MFERFTERARQVVVLAQDEARTRNHNYIGTEHILLGLLREERSSAARILDSLEITSERVHAEVVRLVGEGTEVSRGQLPFTPRAKKTLELALREALSLGHRQIGPEHVLLGLLRVEQGVAVRILESLGTSADEVRADVLSALDRSAEGSPREPPTAPRELHFTRGAEKVLELAQAEARALKHDSVGAEHLVLGLLRDEHSLAAQVLGSLVIGVEGVRAQVIRIGGEGDAVPTGEIPLTVRAKRVLHFARREALSLGHHRVGTEHILLGLLRELRKEIIGTINGPTRERPV
jgi:ATP-dependent Clp protease ATP-binding subunit ClpA